MTRDPGIWVYIGLSIVVSTALSASGNYVTVEDPDSFFVEVVPAVSAWGYGLGVGALILWMHYHACRMTYRRFLVNRPPRERNVLFCMLCLAAMHIGQMTVWGVAMHIADDWLKMGTITGDTEGRFIDYLNFSMATYTSLGLGDITPTGWLKVLTGIATLVGLLCIGWSASMFVGKMGAFLEDDSPKSPPEISAETFPVASGQNE